MSNQGCLDIRAEAQCQKITGRRSEEYLHFHRVPSLPTSRKRNPQRVRWIPGELFQEMIRNPDSRGSYVQGKEFAPLTQILI